MKINLKVHPNSSSEKISKFENQIEVWVKEKAIDGKANEKVLKLLKNYFGKEIKISSGFFSKKKIIDVDF
jgi:uncharacterized protein (TIGR00251 family)